VKKLDPALRRRQPAYSSEKNIFRRTAWRLREDSQFQRSAVQLAFVLLCLWIGIQFALFMAWGESAGQLPYVERPPGVEGFLPISALMSLKYWASTGLVNGIHPAAMIILVAVIAVSVAAKKAFCSWLCPVGTLSESLWMLGRKLFGRTLTVPRWLDYPLRALKYLLLLFFVLSIHAMSTEALRHFLYSPYNRVADIKMYLFFAEISTFALWTIIILVLLSVVIQNFWCRYLCPYGALLGILSWLSPLKITRRAESCIDCELCTKACPSAIRVHTSTRVRSDECTACMSCVEACPVKDTLTMALPRRTASAPGWVITVLVVGTFVAVTGTAMLVGLWQNDITREEYLRRFGELDKPVYQHFRGEVPAYGPND
jgi:polyferredoxin